MSGLTRGCRRAHGNGPPACSGVRWRRNSGSAGTPIGIVVAVTVAMRGEFGTQGRIVGVSSQRGREVLAVIVNHPVSVIDRAEQSGGDLIGNDERFIQGRHRLRKPIDRPLRY